jgi:hypothetical protein
MAHAGPDILPLLQRVKDRADSAGVFESSEIRDGTLICRAKDSAAPASYRLQLEGPKLWVSLVMADRWLSGSIELHLIHTGDKIEELVEEELVELGYQPGKDGPRASYEHFRSSDLLFTFRTPVPVSVEQLGTPEAARRAAAFLLAYEACFRELGDMTADVEE